MQLASPQLAASKGQTATATPLAMTGAVPATRQAHHIGWFEAGILEDLDAQNGSRLQAPNHLWGCPAAWWPLPAASLRGHHGAAGSVTRRLPRAMELYTTVRPNWGSRRPFWQDDSAPAELLAASNHDAILGAGSCDGSTVVVAALHDTVDVGPAMTARAMKMITACKLVHSPAEPAQTRRRGAHSHVRG